MSPSLWSQSATAACSDVPGRPKTAFPHDRDALASITQFGNGGSGGSGAPDVTGEFLLPEFRAGGGDRSSGSDSPDGDARNSRGQDCGMIPRQNQVGFAGKIAGLQAEPEAASMVSSVEASGPALEKALHRSLLASFGQPFDWAVRLRRGRSRRGIACRECPFPSIRDPKADRREGPRVRRPSVHLVAAAAVLISMIRGAGGSRSERASSPS
jgi:hypothetical protein